MVGQAFTIKAISNEPLSKESADRGLANRNRGLSLSHVTGLTNCHFLVGPRRKTTTANVSCENFIHSCFPNKATGHKMLAFVVVVAVVVAVVIIIIIIIHDIVHVNKIIYENAVPACACHGRHGSLCTILYMYCVILDFRV
jgi:hypothetical protein